MSIEKQSNNQVSERIKLLRAQKGLSQAEFSRDFSRYVGRKTDYSVGCISAWEVGRKVPSLVTLYKLAGYFNCSIDYLCNLTNEVQGTREVLIDQKSTEERDAILDESKLLLEREDYKKYDCMPVFVAFKNHEYKNQWAFLCMENNELIFMKFRIPLGQYEVSLYVYPLPKEMYFNFWKMHAYSLQQMMQANTFWVEIYSYDPYVKGEYNGWYMHNENRTAIVNCNNGLTLPYSGLNVSYVAYRSANVN